MKEIKKYLEQANYGFSRKEKNGVVFFTIPAFDVLRLRHGFSTRIGGASEGPFESLNLSAKREPNQKNVQENFRRMGEALGVTLGSMVICHYAHGTRAERVKKEHRGMGILRPNQLPECDGIVTGDKDVTAVSLHADCNALFFADVKGRAVGVCHAGWRGTLGGMTRSMINKLKEEFGVLPEEVLVGIGPAIGPCCFEVQDDVAQPFVDAFGSEIRIWRDGRQYLDLWLALGIQLMEEGVPPENVTFAELCTHCHPELFYSHRRDRGKTGAMGSFISLD